MKVKKIQYFDTSVPEILRFTYLYLQILPNKHHRMANKSFPCGFEHRIFLYIRFVLTISNGSWNNYESFGIEYLTIIIVSSKFEYFASTVGHV